MQGALVPDQRFECVVDHNLLDVGAFCGVWSLSDSSLSSCFQVQEEDQLLDMTKPQGLVSVGCLVITDIATAEVFGASDVVNKRVSEAPPKVDRQ